MTVFNGEPQVQKCVDRVLFSKARSLRRNFIFDVNILGRGGGLRIFYAHVLEGLAFNVLT